MKNLLRLSVVMLGLGMLGATGCSSCMPPAEDTSSKSMEVPQSYTCGPQTHRVGNQCIGDVAPKPQPQTIQPTGNN